MITIGTTIWRSLNLWTKNTSKSAASTYSKIFLNFFKFYNSKWQSQKQYSQKRSPHFEKIDQTCQVHVGMSIIGRITSCVASTGDDPCTLWSFTCWSIMDDIGKLCRPGQWEFCSPDAERSTCMIVNTTCRSFMLLIFNSFLISRVLLDNFILWQVSHLCFLSD